MVPMDGFADRIRLALELSGMTQVQLAKAIDVSPQAIGRWLRDEVEDILAKHLFHAADATQVDPRWLATGQGEARPERGSLSFTGALLAEKIGAKSESAQRALNDLLDHLD